VATNIVLDFILHEELGHRKYAKRALGFGRGTFPEFAE